MSVEVREWLDVEAQVEPEAIRAGGHGVVQVVLRVPDGGHVESNEPSEEFLVPTEVVVEGSPDLVLGPPDYPRDEVKSFPWSPVLLRVFRGTVRVQVPFAALADSASGERRIRGRVRYQGCTETLCLPPAERTFEATVSVMAAGKEG